MMLIVNSIGCERNIHRKIFDLGIRDRVSTHREHAANKSTGENNLLRAAVGEKLFCTETSPVLHVETFVFLKIESLDQHRRLSETCCDVTGGRL